MQHRFVSLLLGLGLPLAAGARPVDLVNPSGEINNGVDRTPITDPSVPGWGGSGGQVIQGNIDFGNGAWRLSFEDSQEIYQMTPHSVAAGESFSLRFDAAMFSGTLPGGGNFTPDLTLVGPGVMNGDFNADPSGTDARSFADTPEWYNLAGDQGTQATRLTGAGGGIDGSRNAVITAAAKQRAFALDTGHDLASGERFQAIFSWRDAANWTDAEDRIRVALITTSDDSSGGDPTLLQELYSPVSLVDGAVQTDALIFDAVPAAAEGRRLFVVFEGADGDGNNAGFARLDNFVLQRGSVTGGNAPRVITAELYVEDEGARVPVASRSWSFKTPEIGIWDHYHLAVPTGSVDAHAGQTVGIRFLSNDGGPANFQSVDNVRLEVWPGSPPDGAFADDWNATPDQPWAGPGYWANRLQDWEVRGGRVQCLNGSRERLTLHRPGTSLRGNGGDFSLSVRTGPNTGSPGAASRSGFLIGAAPNVDWRGALLVHDGLGRDFGLFLGIDGEGTLRIEDYSTGTTATLASAATAGFGQGTRLDLDATYDASSGNCTLQLAASDAGGVPLGSVAVTVPSDRVLGAFGLLSHHGGSGATHWFDDFSGSGPALQPETDRHLAILGAMHTLSRGTLKLTAQLSPLDLASTPPLALDTWNGSSWQEVATAAVDDVDDYSSYTATFELADWNDTVDTDYRIRVDVGGIEHAWTGTIRRDPVDKEEIVIAMSTCQRITDGSLQNDGFDWTPVRMWQPHGQTYTHLAKHRPDVLLAHGDQIYEGQPTGVDGANLQLDYLYKWNLWVLQVRELTREIPTVAIPDDHDIYQGNLWGEGGIATGNQNTGGYVRPAAWVRMVERSQTSNLPDPDPYNPLQPPPPVAQGIGVYFTGMTYGRLGFAILEDRKFKTGKDNPPSDPRGQVLLGERQHEFLRAWNEDWAGQDLKLVVSQSPMGNLRTHASGGYGFSLNDQDTHGWPVHRRNEAWDLWRVSRMFQLAGDQHLATLAHHGVEAPRDAGISFTAPAIANFFPRAFDPVNNSNGGTSTVNVYEGDFFFDGTGTLPDGTTPNRAADDPHHFAMLAAGNPDQYYGTTRGIDPFNLHDRGAGYGITRVNRKTRRITFECWPIHADPAHPQTGGQFTDWPQTFRQTDNDGRVPTGYLPVVDTLWRNNSVVRVYDESSGELVHAMRVRGNRYRPPVFDNAATYRVEIAHGDAVVSETLSGQVPAPPAPPAIHSFVARQPSVVAGQPATLSWDVSSPTTLGIDPGPDDVQPFTVDGIGYLEVNPSSDTTYTLTLDGGETATATVRVFPDKAAWLEAHFTPAEQADPEVSGDDADPDGDGSHNGDEFRFQTDPRDPASKPLLEGRVTEEGGMQRVVFDTSWPLDATSGTLVVERSDGLAGWAPLPSNSYEEVAREEFPASGTTRITLRLVEPLPLPELSRVFFRGRWLVADS